MGEDDRRSDEGTIVVIGTGRVNVEPDVADLRLGLAVARPTVEAARAEAATTMAAVLAAIEAAGVEGRDVRTALLSVQPRSDYRDGSAPVLTGYELANIVAVTVRDLRLLGAVIEGALRAGATSMDGLGFRVEDPSAAERTARLAAMGAARSRADVLAAAADLTIVGVGDIVEGTAVPPPTPRSKERMMLAASDAATPIEAGTIEVSVSVTVSYRVR